MRCGGLRAGTRGAGTPPVPIMRPCPELAEDRLAYSKRYRRVRTGCGALTAKARPHRQKIALRGQALRRGANEAAFAIASGPRERGQNGTLVISRGLLARNDLNNELSNWMKPQMKNWKRKLWTPAAFMASVILSLPGSPAWPRPSSRVRHRPARYARPAALTISPTVRGADWRRGGAAMSAEECRQPFARVSAGCEGGGWRLARVACGIHRGNTRDQPHHQLLLHLRPPPPEHRQVQRH